MLSRIVSLVLLLLISANASRAADQVYYFKKLLIADTEVKVGAMPATAGGDTPVYAEDVPAVGGTDFPSKVVRFVGAPITNDLLNALAGVITEYARQHDRLVKFTIPTQDISSGVVRFVVTPGRYNDLIVAGNKWFSSEFLRSKLGINPGDEVRFSALEAAVNWANTNPFRHIQVLIKDLPTNPGKADLLVGVEDRRPLRFAASYDNNGTPLLGQDRYTASIQMGNLWGHDHQASYQFMTTDDVRKFQAHTLNYRMPLPWRHYIELTTSYARVRPDFKDALLTQEGESEVADLRYSIPMGGGDRSGEIFATLDFKESNNNLEFGGNEVSKAKVDTFQLETGFTSIRRDTKGAWLFGATANLSPGNINSRNTDKQFQPDFVNFRTGRTGAKARYVTGVISIQRLQRLDRGWDMFSRFTGQVTSTNLISNEQLVIGGANSVRGFRENVQGGDQGFVINNDLESPSIERKISHRGKSATLQTRFVVFYDFGEVAVKHPSVFDLPLRPIASTGLGVRMNVANNFSLNFDYGWEVTHPKAPIDNHDRGHIKVVLAF